ncbi:MAG: hypothetical protein MSS83_05520 [Methanobrevibacter sp.]|uniref:hypothetical protein n=1 Tax=Methanobrevibacter sp. TaxID=66852 RepID=UPI0031F55D5B|nr:hypothetical protein [Methanobrevibacter sp.]
MEEKERFELFGEFGIIHDTSPNAECMLLNKFQTCEILNKQDKENQQLAEKDKQIKTYAHEIVFLDKKIANIKNSCDYYMKRANDLVLKQNQKAIEQLEKVKDYFIEGYAVCKNFSDFYWNFTEQIDNQIEALTHQHEDKGE